MGDFSAEGLIRVDYVPVIANVALPTTTELNAGTPLSIWLTPDGWSPQINQNAVDTASLADVYDTQVPGSEGGPITLTLKRSDNPATDTPWNLFKVQTIGFLVAREGGVGLTYASAWASSQKLQVYPGKNHRAQPAATARNTLRTFTATWYVNPAPNRDATVA